MKYYVVKKGRQTGIFLTWPECQEQIKGYSGAVFKSFTDLDTAQAYFDEKEPDTYSNGTFIHINWNLPSAYIDGSNSKKNNCYGYGGYITAAGQIHIIQGKGNALEFLPEKNIAGELIGALQVPFTCQRLQIPEINLFFDYAGIESYINGSWEAKTPLALYYKQAMDLTADKVKVHFYKVKGHTGIAGNELADILAKEAAGVTLRKKDLATLQAFKEIAGTDKDPVLTWGAYLSRVEDTRITQAVLKEFGTDPEILAEKLKLLWYKNYRVISPDPIYDSYNAKLIEELETIDFKLIAKHLQALSFKGEKGQESSNRFLEHYIYELKTQEIGKGA